MLMADRRVSYFCAGRACAQAHVGSGLVDGIDSYYRASLPLPERVTQCVWRALPYRVAADLYAADVKLRAQRLKLPPRATT